MILDLIKLDEWTKKQDILDELKAQGIFINERNLRSVIENSNKKFAQGEVDFYIAHSARGYKKTFNYDEMKQSIADNRKRALTMLKACSEIEKAFEHRNNIRFDL